MNEMSYVSHLFPFFASLIVFCLFFCINGSEKLNLSPIELACLRNPGLPYCFTHKKATIIRQKTAHFGQFDLSSRFESVVLLYCRNYSSHYIYFCLDKELSIEGEKVVKFCTTFGSFCNPPAGLPQVGPKMTVDGPIFYTLQCHGPVIDLARAACHPFPLNNADYVRCEQFKRSCRHAIDWF